MKKSCRFVELRDPPYGGILPDYTAMILIMTLAIALTAFLVYDLLRPSLLATQITEIEEKIPHPPSSNQLHQLIIPSPQG